jgi:hypothetical protein
VILEGSYCRTDYSLCRRGLLVIDPNAWHNGPIFHISDDLWDLLAEAYRLS